MGMLGWIANLDFAGGQAAVLVAVPDVVGQAQAAGTSTLTGAEFTVAVVTAYSSTVPAGTIISQAPVGGSMVSAGSLVTITVSLGDMPQPAAGGGGGGGSIAYRPRYESHGNKKLDEMLDEVVAEVMYRDITEVASEADKAAAAAVVRPQAKSEAAIPAAATVNWEAVESDVTKVRALLKIWRDVDRKRQIMLADDEWLMTED